MNRPFTCDVLVAGAGPAGGAAALAAAQAGARVLLVERRPAPGRPVQCAEYLPLPAAGPARAAGAACQPVRATVVRLPSGARHTDPVPGLMIHRDRLDAGLATRARAAGAVLMCGWRLAGLDARRREAVLVRGRAVQRVRFGCCVAADGPRSAAARALGLAPLPVMAARQVTVPLAQAQDHCEVWLGPAWPGGYAWLFPKGDRAHLGAGWSGRLRADPVVALHRGLHRAGRVGAAVLAATGGLIPVGGLREPVAPGPVLFAGDAAGLAHPVTGAGIAPALASGALAGAAAAAGTAAAWREYGEELGDTYGAALARAVARRREAAAGMGDDAAARRGWVAFPQYHGREAAA